MMIYDFNLFRLLMLQIIEELRDEARWAPMERMKIAAAVCNIEDAVAGRYAMPTRVIMFAAGMTCPVQPWRDLH